MSDNPLTDLKQAQREAALRLVREIANNLPFDVITHRCHFCDGEREHYPDCIWLQAARIIEGDDE